MAIKFDQNVESLGDIDELAKIVATALAEAKNGGAKVTVSHGSIHKRLAEAQLKPLEKMRGQIKERFKFDAKEAWSQRDDFNFSVKKARETLRKKFNQEALSDAAFAMFTRFGVQATLVDQYNLIPTIYKDIADIVASRGRENWYNSLARTEIPVEVKAGESYPETRLIGLGAIIVNKKFGEILSIEEELIDDDQTGEIIRRAQEMGELMVYAEELESMKQLFNAASLTGAVQLNITYQGTAETTGQISQDRLEAAWTQATVAKDFSGQFMMFRPDTLVVAPTDEILAEKLMRSMFSPSVPGNTGAIGYFGTTNVLQGKFKISTTPLVQGPGVRAGLTGGAAPWALVQSRKSLKFQNRTPIETKQEVPDSGDGFMRDEWRWKCRRRFGVGITDPRFILFGN